MELKDVGIINVGAFAGKGIQVLADYIDTKMPAPTVGLPVAAEWYKRPSTYINLLGGVGLQIAALYSIKNENLKLATIVAGANMTTKAIDIAKEALATPTVTARLPARAAPLRVTPIVTPTPVAAAAPGLVTVD